MSYLAIMGSSVETRVSKKNKEIHRKLTSWLKNQTFIVIKKSTDL